jgi:hypothetical protein
MLFEDLRGTEISGVTRRQPEVWGCETSQYCQLYEGAGGAPSTWNVTTST